MLNCEFRITPASDIVHVCMQISVCIFFGGKNGLWSIPLVIQSIFCLQMHLHGVLCCLTELEPCNFRDSRTCQKHVSHFLTPVYILDSLVRFPPFSFTAKKHHIPTQTGMEPSRQQSVCHTKTSGLHLHYNTGLLSTTIQQLG